MSLRLSTVLVAGALTLAPAVSIAAATTDRATAGQLEARADQLEARALATKGGPQQELLMRRARLQRLIDRIDAGEHVDPGEVDDLLNQLPPS